MALDLQSASRGRFVFTLSDVIELLRLALNTKVKTMNGPEKKSNFRGFKVLEFLY